jgi:hypothetical protein
LAKLKKKNSFAADFRYKGGGGGRGGMRRATPSGVCQLRIEKKQNKIC